MNRLFLLTFLLFFLLSCSEKKELSFETLSISAEPESGEPRLYSYGDELILSWITLQNEKNHLFFSRYEDGAWGVPQLILADTSWFVNWADFPAIHIDPQNKNNWVASFLKKSSSETFSYDINYIYSKNGGEDWSKPQKLHADTTLTEHGFISMFDDPKGIGAIWLDGRHTLQGHEHKGAMTLRTAIIDQEGNAINEELLDNRICDCCQTAAVNTPTGVIALYRNRTSDEIRDIWMVRKENGIWKEPESFHDDGWLIPGCPVNGPALAARENGVAAAWFTAAQDSARVLMKISKDGGSTFTDPIHIDNGSPAGRVDITITESNLIAVSWIENLAEGGASFMISFYDFEGHLLVSKSISGISPARGSGFPQIMANGNQIIAAWTDVFSKTIKSSVTEINF